MCGCEKKDDDYIFSDNKKNKLLLYGSMFLSSIVHLSLCHICIEIRRKKNNGGDE